MAWCSYDGGDCCSGQDVECQNCDGTACICHMNEASLCAGMIYLH